jgi:hypothetical protein
MDDYESWFVLLDSETRLLKYSYLGWGELLVAFFAPLRGQRESMADRIGVFLEDLMAASGSLTNPDSARFNLYEATRLRGQEFVALVSGSTNARSRERVSLGSTLRCCPRY